ncbi:hypothetical protein [Bacillus alkalicellulosilyticus]|uniref:hypothetical protein n=1 Tax=Alkalihalobacterium alkalicellulosilyticum TaxID=1912214 RepID=UPI000996F511|nr:hypothetical protein [Bacillus alkalicellulosilyticus]
MKHTVLLQTAQNKSIELRPKKIIIYMQCKVIEAEAIQENLQVYYLFYFKNQYVTTVKATRLKRHSFIENAYKKGFVLHNPLPLLPFIIKDKEHLSLLTFTQLLNKLEKQFLPLEKTIILTYFDSFISKNKLLEVIKPSYYHFYRDGKSFLSFQLLQVIHDFSPAETWVHEFLNKQEYTKYKTHEYEQDLLLTEKQLFLSDDEKSSQLYETLLTDQARWVDLFVHYLRCYTKTPTETLFQKVKNLASSHLHGIDMMPLLENVIENTTTPVQVKYALLESYLASKEYSKACSFLIKHHIPFSPYHIPLLEKMLTDANLTGNSFPLASIQALLIEVAKQKANETNSLLQMVVSRLLKDNSTLFVKTWLKPFQPYKTQLPCIQDVNRMVMLEEDADQQFKLGELYYQYKLYTKALECFQWEYELNDLDRHALHWLLKINRELGYEEEANILQQQYVDLQKWSS